MKAHIIMERIGELADKCDSAMRTAQTYEPDHRRSAYLTGALHGARDQLRQLFIEMAGDNPWQDARHITGERP